MVSSHSVDRQPRPGADLGPEPRPGADRQPGPGAEHPPVVSGGPAVVLDGAGRRFGANPALANLSFTAPAGAITAMLGPNGAGKTTALRLITGALTPDSGTVRVFGLDPGSADGEAVRRQCGVVTAKPSLYDRLSGLDNLRYAAKLYGLGRGRAVDDRLREAASLFGIDDALDQPVGGYSTGMKTRLALTRAVAHGPELLLLDEPTSGLDPESAAVVLDLVRRMTGHGRTVILCTHLLAEADGLADRIVVLERGSAVAGGDPRELAADFWPHPQVRFEAEHGPDLDRLASQPGVLDYAREGGRALVSLDDAGSVADLILALTRDGVRLGAVEPCRPRLEDLYFAIQAHRRGQGEATPPSPGPKNPPEMGEVGEAGKLRPTVAAFPETATAPGAWPDGSDPDLAELPELDEESFVLPSQPGEQHSEQHRVQPGEQHRVQHGEQHGEQHSEQPSEVR
jgi:ABC-2 type transport system ATP-binding protein